MKLFLAYRYDSEEDELQEKIVFAHDNNDAFRVLFGLKEGEVNALGTGGWTVEEKEIKRGIVV